MLTIYIDFKAPASYLALAPTLVLAEETGTAIQWLPFSTRQFAIPEKQPDETVGDSHRRVRALARRDTHLHYAQIQGLEMRFADIPAGSDMALAAMSAIDGDPLPFMRAAFAAYWSDQADLNDPQIVTSLLHICSIRYIDPQRELATLHAIREGAIEGGIFETPFYKIDDQLFLGREHLPWIRNIIMN